MSVIKGEPRNPLSPSDQVCNACLAAETSSGVAPVEKAKLSINAVLSGVGSLATQPTISAAAMIRRRARELSEGAIA